MLLFFPHAAVQSSGPERPITWNASIKMISYQLQRSILHTLMQKVFLFVSATFYPSGLTTYLKRRSQCQKKWVPYSEGDKGKRTDKARPKTMRCLGNDWLKRATLTSAQFWLQILSELKINCFFFSLFQSCRHFIPNHCFFQWFSLVITSKALPNLLGYAQNC